MKVVYFGTPDFAAEVLSFLLKNGINISAVITKPDRPKGRSGHPLPTPVKQVALAQNPPLPLYQPALVSDPAFAPILAEYQPDLFVVVAYGEIIKQHLLDMPRLGCINVHASLLPKYRGAAPIQHSILNGDKETGITIMHMAKKMDAGNIIKMVKVPIGPETTYGELEKALCTAGSKALLDVLRDYEAGKTPSDYAQDHSLVTFAPKIELENCEIDWTKPANEIHDLIRGVNPEPGAWCYVTVKREKKRLKISKSQVVKSAVGYPGEILKYGKEGFVVACGEGALRIIELQLEGKRAMAADELIRGMPAEQISLSASTL